MTASGLVPTGPGAVDVDWGRRCEVDAAFVQACLPHGLRRLHDTVIDRARCGGAHALVLTGSTARRSRTEISDLDYHLIGAAIEVGDLSRELDVHVLSSRKLRARVLEGDDFVHWSLRFGRVVFDDGAFRDAFELLRRKRPWPDVTRKRKHAANSLELADRFVQTGDLDGAIVQVRTALCLTARAWLLATGTFPLARDELAGQLRAHHSGAVADHLSDTIHGRPELDQLAQAVAEGRRMLAGSPGANA